MVDLKLRSLEFRGNAFPGHQLLIVTSKHGLFDDLGDVLAGLRLFDVKPCSCLTILSILSLEVRVDWEICLKNYRSKCPFLPILVRVKPAKPVLWEVAISAHENVS